MQTASGDTRAIAPSEGGNPGLLQLIDQIGTTVELHRGVYELTRRLVDDESDFAELAAVLRWIIIVQEHLEAAETMGETLLADIRQKRGE